MTYTNIGRISNPSQLFLDEMGLEGGNISHLSSLCLCISEGNTRG